MEEKDPDTLALKYSVIPKRGGNRPSRPARPAQPSTPLSPNLSSRLLSRPLTPFLIGTDVTLRNDITRRRSCYKSATKAHAALFLSYRDLLAGKVQLGF